MKTFAKKFPTFWTGQTARRLAGKGPHVRLLADYLFTGPEALAGDNYGIYYVERDVILRRVECDNDTFNASVQLLAEQQVAFWDSDTEWVFVREAAHWQYGTPLLPRDYNCNNARRFYKGLPKNPWLGPWFDRYVYDLCLQYSEEKWVDRREWAQAMPAIASYLQLPTSNPQPRPVEARPPEPEPERVITASELREHRRQHVAGAVRRLQAIRMNGAIGHAIAAAVEQLQEGDAPLEDVDRELIEVCVRELGDQVLIEARAELAAFRHRLPALEYEQKMMASQAQAARRILGLPIIVTGDASMPKKGRR